jgi:hydrogenase nickel incorporation protein HypB
MSGTTTVNLERKVLSENDRLAAELRGEFTRHGIFCLNLIGSPGSGKTALLERTLASFPPDKRVAVLTGDIRTDADARRLARYGFPVRQITTAGACHLDAKMVVRALEGWDLASLDLLFIENVGNLVCPTSYDLGEAAKVVLLSVPEGEEKPLKYPGIFFK